MGKYYAISPICRFFQSGTFRIRLFFLLLFERKIPLFVERESREMD